MKNDKINENAIKKLKAKRNAWVRKMDKIEAGDIFQIKKRLWEISQDRFVGDPNIYFRCEVCNDRSRGWVEYGADGIKDYVICIECETVFSTYLDEKVGHIYEVIERKNP
jgi:hypothetical protein